MATRMDPVYVWGVSNDVRIGKCRMEPYRLKLIIGTYIDELVLVSDEQVVKDASLVQVTKSDLNNETQDFSS